MKTKRIRFTQSERRAVWNKTGGVCYICQHPVAYRDMEIEHVIPLYRGGTNRIDNLLPAHQTCNRVKGKKLL